MARKFAIFQSVGQRGNQEDAAGAIGREVIRSSASQERMLGVFDDELVAVVCDGMGGHASGEVASRVAVDAFLAAWSSSAKTSTSIDERLFNSCSAANLAIASTADADPAFTGMGTTLVGIALCGKTLHWVSIGDSHLLLWRGRRILKLNKDHSMRPVLDAMEQKGLLTPEEVVNHPERKALRSALTGDMVEHIDTGVGGFRLKSGDILLLASDGADVIAQARLSTLLAPRFFWGADQVAKSIVEEADRVGGPMQDNTTALVVVV